MRYTTLVPAISDVLAAIRKKTSLDDVVSLIIERACTLAQAVHGSFVSVDHKTGLLAITHVFGSDWTDLHQNLKLRIGQGVTGRVAATGKPFLCRDTSVDPNYYPLFDYVRSELVVPVVVHDKVWGLINIDGTETDAFDEHTLTLLTLFAELTASAITLHLEMEEQKKLHRHLLQSEKLASMGEAIAGIAHEINNPLTAILGHASLLEMTVTDEVSVPHLQAVISESQRAAALIKSMLRFFRNETESHEPIDVGHIMREAAALHHLQLRYQNTRLEIEEGKPPCTVMVSLQQIKQVILNLILNADQAIGPDREDGLISIASEVRGDRVSITVSDNGGGIPASIQGTIFDPFFTTKQPGEGTGLGLAIAHSVMAAHGGSITLTKSSPAGSVFTLELPCTVSAAEPAHHETTPEICFAPLRGRVLVVDDEPLILNSVQPYLSMLNLETMHAGSATEALAQLKAAPFDLILSDVRMPGMDGIQLYEAACGIDPRYARKFILMSGDTIRDHTQEFLRRTGLPFIEKPFTFDQLHSKLSLFLAPLSAA